MLIGEYVVVLQDSQGNLLTEHVFTASSGHPQSGDEVQVGDALYVVERVLHEMAPDDLSSRGYTHARVFVSPKRGCGHWSSPQPGPGESSLVQPFRDPRGRSWHPGLRASILPAELIVVLVGVGYRMQATELKSRRRVAARLVRDGYGWFVERQSPDELWRLSRRAKRAYGEAISLAQALAEGGCPVASGLPVMISDDLSPACEARPSPCPRPLAAPPALRLV